MRAQTLGDAGGPGGGGTRRSPRWLAEPNGQGPLTREKAFLFCHLLRGGAGDRMSAAAVRRVVARRTGEPNLCAVGFSVNCLRVTAAQDLLAAGVDLPQLMQMGRRSTPAVPGCYSEICRLRMTLWSGVKRTARFLQVRPGP